MNYLPKISISMIVRHLKQISTIGIWDIHEKFLKTQFWKHRIFWSDGYFVTSVGNASTETIIKYIEEQG